MDTSDSEHFESADEDFNSDTEDKNVQIKTVSTIQKDIPELSKLKEMTINEETKVGTEKKTLETNTISKGNSSRDLKRNDATTDKPEKRSKPPRSKLGVKLGTKISSTDSNSRKGDNTENKLKSNYEYKTISNSKSDIVDDNDKTYVSALKDIKNEENLQKLDKKEEATFDEETNMWEDDEWDPIPNTDNKLTNENKDDYHSNKINQNNSNSSWGGWGNWDVTSLLTTATMGVTTITNHVSQGLTTVLESGIGVPEPEELARLHKRDEKSKESIKIEEKEKQEVESGNNSSTRVPDLTFGLGSFVSGVSQITKLVETTGNKVISSGLDTLETIGKKTMEVLQEGDPGLKKKRAFLKIESNKPVLSHMLREAKEKAEQENKLAEEKHVSKKANYETLFDDHQGLAHLEALEMLSRQCDIKLKTLLESQSGADLTEMQETLNQIKELCELTDEDEDEKEVDESEVKEKLETAVTELNISISYNKLLSTWKDIDQWLENLDLNVYNAAQLHEESINILAQLTAVAVELFHKTGELLLIKEHRSTVDEADSLVQLTTTMTTLISDVARKASNKLNEKASQSGNKDNINQFITNVYFEATNSSSYIKNAFELLIPVLQVGAV